MTFPTLETERLTLRPVAIADVDALHRLWTDAEVRRFLWDNEVISRERAEETVVTALDHASRAGLGMWVLHQTGSTEVAGFCGFTRRDGEEAPEILYGLAPRHWHRGYATEAARAALTYAFDTLGYSRV